MAGAGVGRRLESNTALTDILCLESNTALTDMFGEEHSLDRDVMRVTQF